MLRFAILTHNHPRLHWDLLLEIPVHEMLRTWRLEKPPTPGESIKADALPDHRKVYLDYEGPLSGDRGEVHRWDAGDYEPLSQSATRIHLRFAGTKTQGEATLSCDASGAWTFALEPAP